MEFEMLEMLKYDLEDYKDELYDLVHFSTTPKMPFKIYSEDYVFDEDKTVKWNREQVKIKNEEYALEKTRLEELKEQTKDKLIEDIAKMLYDIISEGYLRDEIFLSVPQLKLIIKYAIEYTKDSYDPYNIINSIILGINFSVQFVGLAN